MSNQNLVWATDKAANNAPSNFELSSMTANGFDIGHAQQSAQTGYHRPQPTAKPDVYLNGKAPDTRPGGHVPAPQLPITSSKPKKIATTTAKKSTSKRKSKIPKRNTEEDKAQAHEVIQLGSSDEDDPIQDADGIQISDDDSAQVHQPKASTSRLPAKAAAQESSDPLAIGPDLDVQIPLGNTALKAAQYGNRLKQPPMRPKIVSRDQDLMHIC